MSFAGIDSATTSNDGYADLTFLRTRNVTPNEVVDLTVSAKAGYDYSQVDLNPYPFSEGRDSNRYIDDVSLQSLSNSGTGDDGGYGVYTNINNAPDNLSVGSSTTLTVDAATDGADFVDESPFSYPYGDDSNAYIDDVTIDTSISGTISNTGTGDDFGYSDYTNLETNKIGKGQTIDITVEGSKTTANFGHSQAPDPSSNYGGQTNFNGCAGGGLFDDDDCALVLDVEIRDIDRNSGDDNGYSRYTGDRPNPPLEPGARVDLTVEFQAADDGQTINEDATGSIAKAWIDWDRDGTMQSDEEYFVGGGSASGGSTNQFRETTSIRVPDDAKTGSTILRVVNAMCKECNGPPDTNFPADATAGSFSIDHLEKEDYTMDVSNRSDVDAWVDWNHDDEFTVDETIDVGTSLDKTGTFSYTTSVNPPDRALSGSALFRIQQRNDPGEPAPNPANYVGETEDYTLNLEENLNSAVYAFVDWDQDGDFSSSDEYQEIDTSTIANGEPTFSGPLNVPNDAKSGSTLMRVVFQQDGYADFRTYPDLNEIPEDFQGEIEDYTVHVETDTSYVRAWIDWDRDGNFDTADEGPIDVGSVDSPDNQDKFTVSTEVTAPGFTGSGAAPMRVKHEQKHQQTDLTDWDVDGFTGENEDYTVILDQNPGDISDTGNLTLGDSSLVLTNLSAQNLDLTTVLIDEDYSDNTPQNPVFGSDGSFTFSGDTLTLQDATGVLHQANFGIFDVNNINITVQYNPSNPKVKDNNACPILSYQP